MNLNLAVATLSTLFLSNAYSAPVELDQMTLELYKKAVQVAFKTQHLSCSVPTNNLGADLGAEMDHLFTQVNSGTIDSSGLQPLIVLTINTDSGIKVDLSVNTSADYKNIQTLKFEYF